MILNSTRFVTLPSLLTCVRIMLLVVGSIAFLSVSNASSSKEVESSSQRSRGNEPIRVIFDTDMWDDIDDTMALAMLHALQDRDEVNLLAVTVSTENSWSASYVDLLDTFYNHPAIPIGMVRDGVSPQTFEKRFPGTPWTHYTELISRRKKIDGSLMYPRAAGGVKVVDAVALLRRTLAAQPDGSVVIIQVGYCTNLARLLESKPDSVSHLNGYDLVAQKVRLLSAMAGNFHDSQINGKVVTKGSPEFNLVLDVPAGQKLFSIWPSPIVVSGFEIGLTMKIPGRMVQDEFSYVANHPISDTYLTYCEESKAWDPSIKTCPLDHDHATFDLTSVLYAVRPDEDYFSVSPPGKITVLDDGGTKFDEEPRGRHRYLIMDETRNRRTLEAMTLLTSQPPRGSSAPPMVAKESHVHR